MEALDDVAVDGSLAIVQAVFKEYGRLIVERAGSAGAVTIKGDNSPVTETDVEVEKALQQTMADAFPDLPVFGEETGYPADLPPAFWIVDPIDGTQSFIDNTPTFTSMAALIDNGETVASVIYNPSTEAMFVAKSGEGAYKNGVRIELAKLPLPPVALCKRQLIDELNVILKPKNVTCEAAPIGGGFGFTMILDGLAAARFQLQARGFIHDYAPGALLVREAGGVIVPILGDEYTYESCSFVACFAGLEDVLRSHVSRLRELEMGEY